MDEIIAVVFCLNNKPKVTIFLNINRIFRNEK